MAVARSGGGRPSPSKRARGRRFDHLLLLPEQSVLIVLKLAIGSGREGGKVFPAAGPGFEIDLGGTGRALGEGGKVGCALRGGRGRPAEWADHTPKRPVRARAQNADHEQYRRDGQSG